MEQWACCWNRLSVRMYPESGQPVRHSGNVLSVLQKLLQGWVIFHDANMLALEQ